MQRVVLSWCTGSQENNHCSFFCLGVIVNLAVVYYLVLCSGSSEPVHEDRTQPVVTVIHALSNPYNYYPLSVCQCFSGKLTRTILQLPICLSNQFCIQDNRSAV